MVPEMTYIPENIFIALRERLLQEEAFIETYTRIEDAFYIEAHRQHTEQSQRFNKNMKNPNTSVKALTLVEYKRVFYPHTRTQSYIVFNLIEKHFIHPEIQKKASLCRVQLDGTWLEDVNKLIVLALETYRNDPSIFRPYKKELPPLTELALFQNTDIVPTPTDPVNRSYTKGLQRSDLWLPNALGGYSYEEKYGKNNRLSFNLNPEEVFREKITIEEILGKDTACVGYYIASTAKEINQPLTDPFYLKGSNILRDLGWDKRKDMTLTEKLRRVVRHARIAGSVTIYTPRWDLERSGQSFKLNEGNVWYIEADYIYNEEKNIFNEVIIKVTRGPWAQFFMNKDLINQFGYVTKQLMTLNTHQNPIASTLWMPITTNQNLNTKRRVISWLREVFSDEEINDYLTNRKKQHRLSSTWDEALLILTERGIQVDFCERTYPEILRPLWITGDKQKRPRGYFEKTLQAMVTLTTPRPENAKPVKSSPDKSKKTPKPTFSGEQVKKVREDRGWSLRDLAHVADIPYSTIANIERGRNINKKNEEKLLKALPKLSELT